MSKIKECPYGAVHNFNYCGVAYEDVDDAPIGRNRWYYNWFFCTKCLETIYVKIFEGIRTDVKWRATPRVK